MGSGSDGLVDVRMALTEGVRPNVAAEAAEDPFISTLSFIVGSGSDGPVDVRPALIEGVRPDAAAETAGDTFLYGAISSSELNNG